MTPSLFRYSPAKLFAYSLPLVLGGLFMSLSSDDVWPKVGGQLISLFFTLALVVCLRFRLEVDSDGLRLRHFRRIHTVRWDTIEHQRISHLVSSSSVLTMTDERGRKRAFSLEFFTRSQRASLASAIRTGVTSKSSRGRPERR